MIHCIATILGYMALGSENLPGPSRRRLTRSRLREPIIRRERVRHVAQARAFVALMFAPPTPEAQIQAMQRWWAGDDEAASVRAGLAIGSVAGSRLTYATAWPTRSPPTASAHPVAVGGD